MGTELEYEAEMLRRASEHIAEGESRIALQMIQLAEMRERGRDTHEAERLLRVFQDTMDTWRIHREAIQARIGYLKQIGASGLPES